MSFLGLAFLFALPLASLPILLHLFDRQRNLVIEWGAMQFLMEAARKRTSARRLKQWLLLLLRTFAILCLVLALARPLVNSQWLGSSDHNETIVVIDNSLSMTRESDGITLYQSAVRSAVELLEAAHTGDSVRVMLTSPYSIWTTPASIRINPESRSSIQEQLNERHPTLGRSDLLSALFAAVQAESQPGVKRRRVYVFTDGQANDWNTSDDRGWQRFRDVMRSLAVSTELNVVNVGSKRLGVGNLAINQIDANRTMVGREQIVTFTAQIQNHGQTSSDPCAFRWTTSDGERNGDDIPALEPGAIHEVIWKHSLSKLGTQSITGEMDVKDALEADNRQTVIVEVVDRIPVLVVESNPDATEEMQDAFFVQAAMGWIDGEPSGVQGVYAPTLVTLDQLAHTELHQFRTVVIPNLAEVNEDVCRRLHNFVVEGGGLWIALGPRTDIERFNQHFFADGGGLVPLSIDRIVDESGNKDQKTTIDPVLSMHPAVSLLADSERLDTGKVVVTRRFRFIAPASGDDASVLLKLTDGEPFAVEKLIGRGRVIVQAVPLRMIWSELARSQAFVVMIQDWLSYLTQPLATQYNLAPGNAIRLFLPDPDAREATLRTPQGEEVELTADPTNGGVVFRTSRTIQPGEYSLEVGLSGNRIPFLVHRDAHESNLTPLTDVDRQMLAETTGLGRRTGNDSLNSSVPTDPVWPLLLMLLIGLMLAELLLAGNMSRQRFGIDPISETGEALAIELTGLHVGSPRQGRSDSKGQSLPNTPRT